MKKKDQEKKTVSEHHTISDDKFENVSGGFTLSVENRLKHLKNGVGAASSIVISKVLNKSPNLEVFAKETQKDAVGMLKKSVTGVITGDPENQE